jgi:nitroimidazol reductase NimA-like FMN-containing flavoprotein (pyridoxamine 5'-phosphate oxidase superfamily)
VNRNGGERRIGVVIDLRAERSGNEVHTWHGTSLRIDAGFDLAGFLGQPLRARVAAAGPSVRSVWFLWEDGAFWWLTGSWSRLPSILKADPSVALVVDTCDLATGEMLEVTAGGEAEIYQLDPARSRRLLRRYLGGDESRWPERFTVHTLHNPSTRLIRLQPSRMEARELSYESPRGGATVA